MRKEIITNYEFFTIRKGILDDNGDQNNNSLALMKFIFNFKEERMKTNENK
jgi:hypothetical protein